MDIRNALEPGVADQVGDDMDALMTDVTISKADRPGLIVALETNGFLLSLAISLKRLADAQERKE